MFTYVFCHLIALQSKHYLSGTFKPDAPRSVFPCASQLQGAISCFPACSFLQHANRQVSPGAVSCSPAVEPVEG
ncbi:hypothetical protein A4R35_09845 [Thermogemmatispora tikiterensis]|uniref:Uncharacterized protein n=1 Tax=Thermogemmatispora tikiterensis TaxID=1825093 RepID=A0A328VDK8_9CHLR|nr:hypothetical protein A4R35_09845 [Thermogemmatispora tikiterensis]